jgi:hypothetical protein
MLYINIYEYYEFEHVFLVRRIHVSTGKSPVDTQAIMYFICQACLNAFLQDVLKYRAEYSLFNSTQQVFPFYARSHMKVVFLGAIIQTIIIIS